MPKKAPLEYPFVPRSTATLIPGQFWSIPLSNGKYACGRVIQTYPTGQTGARRMFLGALMDWHSPSPPTNETIANAKCLQQAKAHIITIVKSGGAILGHRALQLDGIEPWLFRGAKHHHNSYVQRGIELVRPQTREDDSLPVITVWGYNVPTILAERKWGRKK